jgi:hypothetical protein
MRFAGGETPGRLAGGRGRTRPGTLCLYYGSRCKQCLDFGCGIYAWRTNAWSASANIGRCRCRGQFGREGIPRAFPSVSTKKFTPPQFVHKEGAISCCDPVRSVAKYQQCKREMSCRACRRSRQSGRYPAVLEGEQPGGSKGALRRVLGTRASRPPQKVLLIEWD